MIEAGNHHNAHYQTLWDICRRRTSVREFSPRPVSQALIERILEIAATAPYASGRKNWDIIVVTEAKQREHMAKAVRGKVETLLHKVRADFRADFAAYSEYFSAFATAPAIFVPTYRIAPSLPPLETDIAEIAFLRQWERDNFVKSIACVTTLILLAAEAQELGACCMTGPLLAEAELATLIGAKPGRGLAALVPVGYKKDEREKENAN
jgi:nitroreductase